MMTQPIQTFQKLTSETAGGNADTEYAPGFAHADQRRLEQEARFARAIFLVDAGVWLAKQFKRAITAMKADFKLRTAEAQLYRMSDRELSDLGLCRADIPFAVREPVAGDMPQVDAFTGYATPSNQNVRRAA
jgi:uncharacterized protein YjiS (DUF1127 family)